LPDQSTATMRMARILACRNARWLMADSHDRTGG
jgi:hypothetical protein